MHFTMKQCMIFFALLVRHVTADCYDDWRQLGSAVENSNGGETFVVCPDTTLKPANIESGGIIFTDIWFFASDITLLCGENGKATNNCVFDGGETHLYIPDQNVTGIYVSVSVNNDIV